LTIEKNNANLSSFQNEISTLKEDLKKLKSENIFLSEKNSELEKNLEFEKSENEKL